MDMPDEQNAPLAGLYASLRQGLASAGIEEAGREARIILRLSGFDEACLIAAPETAVPEARKIAIAAIADRRQAGEPLSRILGVREFHGRDFQVTPAVLDPRPDTETLVDAALGLARPPNRILDLGTGSGCLIVTLLLAWPQASGTAVDLSPEALAVAMANAGRHGVAGRLRAVQGSWYAPLDVDDRYDLIVSNPPYIPTGEIAALAREVRDHDPILALDGGADGLDAYRFVFEGARDHLAEAGALLVEAGQGQAADIVRLAGKAGFHATTTYMDMAGIERVVAARRG